MDGAGFGQLNSDGWGRASRVAVLYLALTLLLAYPLTVHPASRVLSASPRPASERPSFPTASPTTAINALAVSCGR